MKAPKKGNTRYTQFHSKFFSLLNTIVKVVETPIAGFKQANEMFGGETIMIEAKYEAEMISIEIAGSEDNLVFSSV